MARKTKKQKMQRGRATRGPARKPSEVSEEARSHVTLVALVFLFTLMAVFIGFNIITGGIIYWLLVVAAAGFLLIEAYSWRAKPRRIKQALLVGVFLLLFDFVFENAGWLAGLWQTQNAFITVGVVPVEIMLVCLLGGTAWALYLPTKFERLHSAVDVLTFAIYGAFGEYMLIHAGLMVYFSWWNSWLAALSYGLTWVILHKVRYRLIHA